MGAKLLQSCLTLVTPWTSLQGSLVCGILQTRILEWVALSLSRDLPDLSIDPVSLMSHTLVALVESCIGINNYGIAID